MLSFFHYRSAKERLAESKKTIHMMGGEDECQPMLLGQRDFLKLEVEFYRPRARISVLILIILPIVLIIFAPTIYGFITNFVSSCCGQ